MKKIVLTQWLTLKEDIIKGHKTDAEEINEGNELIDLFGLIRDNSLPRIIEELHGHEIYKSKTL